LRAVVPVVGLELTGCRGARLGCGSWCAPIEAEHESRRGTPYVHSSHAEAAFLGRDLLLLHLGREGDEHELEAELDSWGTESGDTTLE
jgi:hypothetical protein